MSLRFSVNCFEGWVGGEAWDDICHADDSFEALEDFRAQAIQKSTLECAWYNPVNFSAETSPVPPKWPHRISS